MSFEFYTISLLAILSAMLVVIARNPLYSALSLICNLFCVAALYALLQAHFLVAAQIIVYAGAVMVLVLFVLMLLNIKTEAALTYNTVALILGSLTSVTLLLVYLIPLISTSTSAILMPQLAENQLSIVGDVKSIGRELFTKFLLAFELASAVIMVGVVGAVMLAEPTGATLYSSKPKDSTSEQNQ